MNSLEQTLELPRGGFGKLRLLPDFVRAAAGSRDVMVLDRWVQDGLYLTRKSLGPLWESSYDSHLHHRFIFRPDDSTHTLFGVIRASRDCHDRRFPIVSYGIAPTGALDASPLWLPALQDAIYRDIEASIDEVGEMTTPAQVQARLVQPARLTAQSEAEEERYVSFLEEVECGELCDSLPPSPLSPLQGVLDVLGEGQSFARNIPVGIELPLGQPAYARSLEMRFWIELLMIVLRWYPSSLSLFWPAQAASTSTPTMLLTCRQPAGELFEALLQPGWMTRHLWRPAQDLDVPWRGSSRDRSFPVSARQTLRELLCQLAPGYPSSCRWNRATE